MDNSEIVYLTEEEIDEIIKLETTGDAVEYIEDMTENKKQLVMKLFNRELIIRQWQVIANERY